MSTATAEAVEQTQETNAQRIMRQIAEKAVDVVDVHCPSGIVYKFRKPPKFQVLFEYGGLPQSATSAAVEEWIEAGLIKPDETGEVSDSQIKLTEVSLNLAQRIIDLSHDPKFVSGDARPEKNEISTINVPDEDMKYLFGWVAAGGEVSGMLANFPKGSQSGSLASAHRPKQRHKAK